MATTLAALGAVAALAVVALALFAIRRRLIHHPGGTFDCGLRIAEAAAGRRVGARPAGMGGAGDAEAADREAAADYGSPARWVDGKGWTFGVARYSGDEVAWFRIFSYAPRPRVVLSRPDIVVVAKRSPDGADELALLSGWMIVSCRHRAHDVELAMSEDALTGFLAWLEAAPPGQRVNVA